MPTVRTIRAENPGIRGGSEHWKRSAIVIALAVAAIWTIARAEDPPPPPPPPPTGTPSNLEAEQAAGNIMYLYWDDNSSGESGHEIHVKERIVTGGLMDFTYSVDALTAGPVWQDFFYNYFFPSGQPTPPFPVIPGRAYAFKVAPFTQAEQRTIGSFSNLMPPGLDPDPLGADPDTMIALIAPLAATAKPIALQQAKITWTYAGVGHTGFVVQRQIGVALFQNAGWISNPNSTSFVDNFSFIEGQGYTYVVRAYRTHPTHGYWGWSSPSASSSFTMPGSYTNPVIDLDFPNVDPQYNTNVLADVSIFYYAAEQTYYLYGTDDDIFLGFKVWKSTDLVNWQLAETAAQHENGYAYYRSPTAFPPIPPNNFGRGSFLGPDVFEFGGKFYMFFSANNDLVDNCQPGTACVPENWISRTQRIVLAEATHPAGPFTDFRSPLSAYPNTF